VQADSIVSRLGIKRFVLPMHYKTEVFSDLPYGVDSFLKGKTNVRRIESGEFIFDPQESPGKPEYVVWRY
jgi:hypothetical protein